MLIQFSFGNFLSFKEDFNLSMVASALRESKELTLGATFPLEETNHDLLKSAVVYGANASGKSNLIKAIDFFKWFVINSAKDIQAGEKIPGVESFRLNSETAVEPSFIEALFADAENQYRYGFECDENGVSQEWLYQRANKRKSKEVELFYRKGKEYEIHPKFSVGKEIVAKNMIRDNALLLSVAAQFNDPLAVKILQWLSDTTVIKSTSEGEIWEKALRSVDNPEMHKRIVEFSRYADFGIDDIRKIDGQLVSVHNQYDEGGKTVNTVMFPFTGNESEGTIKYFTLAYPIIDALDNGKRLIIDEFDTKMHPLLTSRIISLFNSKESNPRNAQLIITTHDTNLLNSGLFRRDQIWFTQKDRMGASSLYSLAEYKVRNTSPFEKDYLMGRYGAVPILGQFERLFTSNPSDDGKE